MAKTNNKALAFVCFAVLIDTTGFGIIMPVIPELIMEITGEGLGQAAVYGGWLLFLYALMQFFFAPIMGGLSDRFGRRPVLLIALLAFGLDYLVMGFAPTIGWLFFGRLISGVTGAVFAPANAYIADVTPPDKRAQNFGLVSAFWGLGFILGPVFGGFLGEYGPRVPFFGAAALALLNVVFGLMVFKESLATKDRRAFVWKRANPVGAVARMRRYPLIFGLFAVLFFYYLGHQVLQSTWTYFNIEKFNFSPREIGYSLGFVGIMVTLVQGGLIRVVVPRIGERRAVFFGLLLTVFGFLGFGFASQGWMMYAFTVPFTIGSMSIPALKGIMSRRVPANMQGELQGAIVSICSLCTVISPLLMTWLFRYFTSEKAQIYFPGAAFVAAALLTVFAVIFFIRAKRAPALAEVED